MTALEESRGHLANARVALWDADLAIAQGDHRAGAIQLDLAAAYTAEARKLLAVATSAPAGTPHSALSTPQSK
jgi:hypothetical protein